MSKKKQISQKLEEAHEQGIVAGWNNAWKAIREYGQSPHADDCHCDYCPYIRQAFKEHSDHAMQDGYKAGLDAGQQAGHTKGWNFLLEEIIKWSKAPHDGDCQCSVCHALRQAFITFLTCPTVSPLASDMDLQPETQPYPEEDN